VELVFVLDMNFSATRSPLGEVDSQTVAKPPRPRSRSSLYPANGSDPASGT
jgi:hypothetical protein